MDKARISDVNLHTYLKYKGLYRWRDLYRFMRGWVEKNHYVFYDREYKEKPDQYGMEIEWRARADKKIDGVYKYWIIWYLRIWDQTNVEVEKDGKKEKWNEGRLRIQIDCQVDFDYEGQFESSSRYKKMEKFLLKHVIKEDFESEHQDALYYEMNRFKNEIEAHLKMETATVGSPYHG